MNLNKYYFLFLFYFSLNINLNLIIYKNLLPYIYLCILYSAFHIFYKEINFYIFILHNKFISVEHHFVDLHLYSHHKRIPQMDYHYHLNFLLHDMNPYSLKQ